VGINVINKSVQVDDTHQKRVNTSTDDNPTYEVIDEITLHYIFTRSKLQKEDGDGNPLIYAMKGLKGFGIQPVYRRKIMDRCETIMARLAKDIQFDLIMGMPSSNSFAMELANLAAQVFDKPVLSNDFIRKKSLGELVHDFDTSALPKASNRSLAEYKQTIGLWRKADPSTIVSMKDVAPRIREFVSPLTAAGSVPAIHGSRILVVDDLVSSGSTFLSACSILKAAGCEATGLCFLSRLSTD
jgi:hypothetical protein